MLNTSLINWQKVDGLLPVIVQHAQTGQVLMLGYMNDEALAKTINEGKVTFYSRTKQRLWTKGETSGRDLPYRRRQLLSSIYPTSHQPLDMVRPTGAAFSRKEKRRSSQLLHRDAARQRHKKNCSKGRRRSGRNGASGRFAR